MEDLQGEQLFRRRGSQLAILLGGQLGHAPAGLTGDSDATAAFRDDLADLLQQHSGTVQIDLQDPEYAETLRRSSEDTEQLRDTLEPFGFERTALKTLRFDIDTEFESYKEHDTWKQRFIGYKFQHVLKVEFDSDNEKFGRILYALAHCQLHPEFRISYFVKDPEASKNELLGRAVSDAREKANVLTTAAGVSLKEIQSIDYSWGEINFEYHPMNKELLMEDCMCEPCEAGGSYDVNMEPDDIEVSDTVTVIWEI